MNNNSIRVELKIINKNLMVGTESFPDGIIHNVRYERIIPKGILYSLINKIKTLIKKIKI